ncbi:MAG: glycolate oxidase subunit GlcF [Methylococcaceae bacterium]
MQTQLDQKFSHIPEAKEVNSILRACVHCGFCNATCPTYLINGDELDGPRGRIYLLKQMFEGQDTSKTSYLHLDRCLTCRSCETTCPSGVRYGRLLDIGRSWMEQRQSRAASKRVLRWLMVQVLRSPKLISLVVRVGSVCRFWLPAKFQRQIPEQCFKQEKVFSNHSRKMLLLQGCVQPYLAPTINAVTMKVFDSLNITLIPEEEGCCAAINYHYAGQSEAICQIKSNIDRWWSHIETGIEAFVSTASGCGVMVKEYGDILRYDNAYAEKARVISSKVKDISEILSQEDLTSMARQKSLKIAFHSPCTLQHGQKINGVVEAILKQLGHQLMPIADAHLCCGSAGIYSFLERKMANTLLHNKLTNLTKEPVDVIVTANIGCLIQLKSGTGFPVKHWIEMLV